MVYPVYNEILSLAHEISHQIEQRASHHSSHAHSHHNHHKSDENTVQTDHTHEVLSFVQKVLDTSKTVPDNQKKVVQQVLDKHLVNEMPSFKPFYEERLPLKLWRYNAHYTLGYKAAPTLPPEYIL